MLRPVDEAVPLRRPMSSFDQPRQSSSASGMVYVFPLTIWPETLHLQNIVFKVIVITLHRDGAPVSNGSKSFFRPFDHGRKAPAKMDCAGISVQGKQVSLVRNCVADLALTTLQIARFVQATRQAWPSCRATTAACEVRRLRR